MSDRGPKYDVEVLSDTVFPPSSPQAKPWQAKLTLSQANQPLFFFKLSQFDDPKLDLLTKLWLCCGFRTDSVASNIVGVGGPAKAFPEGI